MYKERKRESERNILFIHYDWILSDNISSTNLKEDEMGRVCSMPGQDEKCIFWLET
jgi:hypothetical protein